MADVEDWLQDPLVKIEDRSYKSRKLKSSDDRQNDLWRGFHFATRLKLDGADHFCRLALGAASMPHDLGLPLLAHRQIEWYLGAFFFELMSAYDTALQELNIVYASDLALKPEDVSWHKIRSKLPNTLAKYIEDERKKDWFCEVRSHRNLATHHYIVPLGSIKAGFGDKPWDYSEHEVSIYCLDNAGETKKKKISVCPTYLNKMVEHIHKVWTEMAQEFQQE